jgi:hypothetical protein
MATMVRPKAAAMPKTSTEVAPVPIPAMTAVPQPISTKANVPINSAMAFFMMMSPLSKLS